MRPASERFVLRVAQRLYLLGFKQYIRTFPRGVTALRRSKRHGLSVSCCLFVGRYCIHSTKVFGTTYSSIVQLCAVAAARSRFLWTQVPSRPMGRIFTLRLRPGVWPGIATGFLGQLYGRHGMSHASWLFVCSCATI